MPEAPEVRLMATALNAKLNNCLLQTITLTGRYRNTSRVSALRRALPLRIRSVRNKGKFIYLELEKQWVIGLTLGMTGYFVIPNVMEQFVTMEGYRYNPKHDHVSLQTSCGDVYLNDPRMFGHLYILSPTELQSRLNKLGPDILSLQKTPQVDFDARLDAHQKLTVADALLDQTIVSGVGNYLRAEAMFAARIAPLRTVASLTNPERARLKRAIQTVALRSLKDQKKAGIYQAKLKVYQNPKASQIQRRGRTIWWMPQAQH